MCGCLCSRSDLIDYDRLEPSNHVGNLNNAFNVASDQLGIPKILDAEGEFACGAFVDLLLGLLSCEDATSLEVQVYDL